MLVFILLGGVWLNPLFAVAQDQQELPMCVQINQQQFKVEVAQTPEQQHQGLQFRKTVPDHTGMLFPYETLQVLYFWMKDCDIPLDILFFKAGKLVKAIDKAPPCHLPDKQCPIYSSAGLADTVLELAAGTRKNMVLNLAPNC